MKMTERNINHKLSTVYDIWTKAHRQINPTVFALDRSLESLDRECFEDKRNKDLEQCIKIDDDKINKKKW